MQQRIEIVGIDGLEYCKIFQCATMPSVGFEVDIAKEAKITNLTSPSPNFFDSNIFTFQISCSDINVTSIVLLNIISNWLYDKLKNKKISYSEYETKISITVKNDD